MSHAWDICFSVPLRLDQLFPHLEYLFDPVVECVFFFGRPQTETLAFSRVILRCGRLCPYDRFFSPLWMELIFLIGQEWPLELPVCFPVHVYYFTPSLRWGALLIVFAETPADSRRDGLIQIFQLQNLLRLSLCPPGILRNAHAQLPPFLSRQESINTPQFFSKLRIRAFG